MSLDSIFIHDARSDEKFLSGLFKKAKRGYPDVIVFIDAVTLKLETDNDFHKKFFNEVYKVFKNVKFIKYLTTSGLMQENSVLSLFRKKIVDIVLPEIENDQTLTSIVNDLFYNQSTFKNFKLIPKDRWERFFGALFRKSDENETDNIKKQIKAQIIESVNILMDRVSGGFSDNEMMRYRPPGEYAKTPFYKLSIDIRNIIENPEYAFDALQIRQSIKNCKTYLNDILTQKDERGISLKITVKINRILQELQRLQETLTTLVDLKSVTLPAFLANATKKWAEYYSPRNWFSKQVSSTVYLITFLATYHNGRTGEKYITSTAKEYLKMFSTAAGGGVIVAFLCYIKLFMGQIPATSPFFKAFFYSLNYAMGFVAIYLFHFTLATKQPAMTASLIAHSLVPDKENNKSINYQEFTQLFSRLSRSQFIAFLGNVILSFLLCTGIFLLLNKVFNFKVIGRTYALHFWDELSQMDWRIFWFASVAGFFLFISGMVSGLVINNQRYNNIPERIYHHPVLKRFFGERKRKKISSWFARNNGGVTGNLIFGFLMGSAFLAGDFWKIPFDIRHITFAAGNLGIGLGGINYEGITYRGIIISFVSVFLIGGFNFIVSFLLSLMLAMRSNNIKLYNIFPMFWAVFKYFLKNPYRFFFPPLWKRKKALSK